MALHLISLALSAILSLADYITENIFPKKLRKNKKLISFSSGVAISYIILDLFPRISSIASTEGKQVFLYALLGFVALNLVEQYVCKGACKPKSHSGYHKSIHVAYFFAYNFFIGMALVNFASKGLAETLLFFVPFLLYIIVETLPQEFEFKRNALKVFYSAAPLFGALLGIYYFNFAISVFGKLLSFITGTLLYVVVREYLPSDEAEKPLYFTTGVFFYALVIFTSWSLA